VLRGGRLFDGTGAAAREATVVIERNHIKSVLPPGAHDWPADARVIDVGGKTVMPGLIDMHVHMTAAFDTMPRELVDDLAHATLRGIERLRYFIESGITTVRDVGSLSTSAFRLKEWVAANRIPGPRMFVAGRIISGTGGHGNGGDEGPDNWRKAVREMFNMGADVIKTGSHFSREEMKAAVEEAHALGLKVTCDCETFYIDWAVQAGVDMIEHPLPRTDEVIRLMAERGVGSIPTLAAYTFVFDQRGGYFGSTSRRFTFSKEANVEMLRRLRRAGVKIGVGLDIAHDWYTYMPGPYVAELQRYVQAGFTISEALVAATKTNAELLDMGSRLGTIERGKLADVIVVKGRPDADLENLANVDLVVRDGWVVVEDGRLSIPRHKAVTPPPPIDPRQGRVRQ
jgi:imidazolonepropionase-like amidohydrolase